MGKKFDFESDLRISEYELDREWKRQPELFGKWSVEAAKAKREAELAKDSVEVVKAEIAKKLRSESETKITDKALDMMILLDSSYKEAFKDYLDKRHDFDILAAAVKAMEQKRDSLEYLTKLFLSEYYMRESGEQIRINAPDSARRISLVKADDTDKEVKEKIILRKRTPC